jgi:hypothetical protein
MVERPAERKDIIRCPSPVQSQALDTGNRARTSALPCQHRSRVGEESGEQP